MFNIIIDIFFNIYVSNITITFIIFLCHHLLESVVFFAFKNIYNILIIYNSKDSVCFTGSSFLLFVHLYTKIKENY